MDPPFQRGIWALPTLSLRLCPGRFLQSTSITVSTVLTVMERSCCQAANKGNKS